MPDKVLSDYIESKRSRGAFTEPEADRFLMPKEAPSVPVSTPKAPPVPGLSSIDARMLVAKAKNSGLSSKQIDQVMKVAEAGGPSMAVALDRAMPSNPNSGLTADNMSPADFWSSAANGIANTFVSFNAGVRQIGATATGATQKEIDAIRDWQRQNEVQITDSTKRMLADDDFNMTKFGFGVGNAVGSVAISLAAAVPLVATGAGAGAAALIGAAASYPMIFNSTFNSAIDSGYSPEDSAKYAYWVSGAISSLEAFPIGKLARTLGSKQVSEIATSAFNKFLPKPFRDQTLGMAVDKISEKMAKDGLSQDVLVDVFLATKNGIRDRLLINGGKTIENASAEAFTEISQNYLQEFSEVVMDDVTKRNQGKGGFGTTMQDVFSKKQFFSALEDGMYGAIAGGGASLAAIGKPLYEQGVYNTLAKFDQKGKLDEGVDRLMSSLQAKIDAGQIDGPTGAQAMQSIQQVATSYRKLGSAITDPKIKMAMFSGVRMKDQLTADMQALQAQKAEVERKIQSGEIDPDIAKFEDRRIDSIIEQKNKQYAFTSQWLTETSSEIFSNRINSIQAQEANVDREISNIQDQAQQAVDSQSKWKNIMGYTPNFASVRLNDLNAGLKAIQDEYNTKEGVYAQEALKDKDLMSDFDVFEEATKTVVDNGKPSAGKFVSDGMGNYAVVVEQATEDGGKRTMYRPVPKTEYYEERLGQIFEANKRFDGIAQKMVEGKELTADEAKLAKDFDVDIANVFSDKKAKSDDKIASSVEKIVFSEDPTSIDMSAGMPEFERQAVLSIISEIKVVTPALAKAVKKGDKKGVNSIVNKKSNAKISGILEKLSLDQEALSKLVEKKPKESKSKKKATQSESSPQEVALRQAAVEAQMAEGPEAADAAIDDYYDSTIEADAEAAEDAILIKQINRDSVDSVENKLQSAVEKNPDILFGETIVNTKNPDFFSDTKEEDIANGKRFRLIRGNVYPKKKGIGLDLNLKSGLTSIKSAFASTLGDIEQRTLDVLTNQKEEADKDIERIEQKIGELESIGKSDTTSEQKKSLSVLRLRKKSTQKSLVDVNRKIKEIQYYLKNREEREVESNRLRLNWWTSQKRTAISYANSMKNASASLLGKLDDPNPNYDIITIKPNNILRIEGFANEKTGEFSKEGLSRLLLYLGIKELPETTKYAYQLLRGKNAPVVAQALLEKGHDVISLKEQSQHNFVLLDKSPWYASRAYMKAKQDGSNPDFVKFIDKILDIEENDSTTTSPEQSAVAAEAAPAETEEQAGQDSESALGLANQEADNIINAIAGDGGSTSGERTVQWTISGATLGKLEASIAEINRLTAEATGQKPSNAGGLTEQDIQSGEKSVTGSDADQAFKEGENVRNFANTLRKVFNVDIEVLSDREWENAGLPITANGIFIGTKGKIYVRDMPGAEGVLIHELGHVAVRVIEKSAPMLALQAYKLVKGTKYEALVRKEYPNLKKETDILREALGWAIQEKGEQLRSAEDPTLYEKFIQMMKRMFKRIAERLGFDAPIDIDSMTLEQFSSEIASKILEGAPFEKAFNIYMQEFQPDPSFGDELSLFGAHVTAASQKPQMITDSSGRYITPTEVAQFKTYLAELQDGNPFAQDAATIENIIKEVIEPMIGNSRNFTDIQPGDLDSKEAKKLYDQLAGGGGVTSKKAKKLLTDIKDSVKKYNKWVLSSHAKVIDNSSGRPVESYAYINSDAESAAAHANVSQLKAANKGLWGKVNQFFLSNYFSELFGIETVAQFLGGDTGIISGIHGMIRKRNNDAATFAKYADDEIMTYKNKLQQVMGLRDINEFFQRKVTVSAFNNMDGNPTAIDLDIPIGAAADIVVNYRTQYLNAKGGPDRTHSSIYYDPTDSAKGATVYANGIQNYRGITQTVEDNEYNLLFTDDQLQELEDLFAPGSEYEFIVNDAFDFYSGNAGQKTRFEMVNEVYRAVKGEDLKAIPDGTYAPTRAYMDGASRSHREMGAAYDDVSFIKPREDLPPRLQGNKDVLSAMESYNRRAQNFIRNAEAAESLLVYTKRVKDKWNDKEMQSKLDWLDQYRKDLNSYEQDRIAAGEKEGLGVSLKAYRFVMSNFSKSVFAFNFANPLKQSVGYMGAYGLGIIDNKYLRKYQPFVIADTAKSYTGYVADDEGKIFGEVEGGTMFFNEQQDALLAEISSYDEMSDIYIRLNDVTANTQGVPMQDIVSAYSSGARGQAIKQFLGEKYDSFTRYGLAPMRRSDRSPILGFYQAAKDQVRDMADAGQLLDATGNPTTFEDATGRMTPAAAQMVADKVTEITYRTNNMYMTNDKTGLQRSHGILAETIGLFTSQPQKVFNLFLQNMFKAARSNFTNEQDVKMLQSSFGYAIIMSAVTTASITVAYSIFKNGGLDDDDEPLRDFSVEFAKNVVGIAPSLFTEILVSALSIFDSRGAVDAGGQNPVFEQITKVLVGINSYRESFDAKTPETELRLEKKAANEITSGLAAMTGVPSSFVRLVRTEFFDTTQK